MAPADKELAALADRCLTAQTPTPGALEAPVSPYQAQSPSAPPSKKSAAQKWQETPRWAKILVYVLGGLAPFSGVLSDVVRGLFAPSP